MAAMGKGRLEAFSDGVLAIIITIMVLELKVPEGHTFEALAPLAPKFCSYAVSFTYVGIYWNNHHHLLHATKNIGAGAMWANLHLLFWLSLIPVATAWMGEHESASAPTALYAFIFFMSGIAYLILQKALCHTKGNESLSKALGSDFKGRLSGLLNLAAIGLAFVQPIISQVVLVLVPLMWLIPDRRMEKVHEHDDGRGSPRPAAAPNGDTVR